MREPLENHCKMKRVYKPNFVSAEAAVIIHLGRPLPAGSSGLPENAAGSLRHRTGSSDFAFSYLALHHEEFTWPSSVTTDAGELLPHRFTLDPCGQDYSLLHLSSSPKGCPDVIRLAALWCSDFPLLPLAEAITRRASLQGKLSIAKNVEQSKVLLQAYELQS